MGDRYLDSGAASSASPYETTATAALSLVTYDALALAVDETIFVAHNHSFSAGTTQILTAGANATALAPQRVICVSDLGTNATPVTAPSAIENRAAAGSAANTSIEGYWAFHGVKFTFTGAGSTSLLILGATQGGPHNITMDTCLLGGASSSSAAGIRLGATANTANDETQIVLDNCVFGPTHANNKISFAHGQHRAHNLSINTTDATPVSLFAVSSGITFDALVENSDLSNATMTNFFSSAGAVCGVFNARNIRLASGVVLCTDDITAPGLKFIARDITVGTTYVPFYSRTYAGEVIHETTILPTSTGDRMTLRDDASEAYTMRLVSANGSYWQPLYSDWININVEDTATAITPFAEILVSGDGAAALTDREVWLEVDAKNVAGTNNHQAARLTDSAGIVAAGTAQAAGTITFTGHGYATPRYHKLALGAAITPTQKGCIRVRVALAKVGTIYIGQVGVA